MGHARGDRAVLDLRPEREHLVAARFDPADLLRKVFHAACGVAAQRLVPLHEAVADVVEALDRLGQRLGEVRQLGLELADALAALAGQFRGVGLVVGDRVADENRNGPIFALCVHVIELSVAGRNHGHRLASGVAPGGCDTAADMVRHFADVLHHGRNVGKDALVFALEDVIRRIARHADDERVVDESLAQRVDCRDSAFQRELRRYFL